jgi:hypothetical protein
MSGAMKASSNSRSSRFFLSFRLGSSSIFFHSALEIAAGAKIVRTPLYGLGRSLDVGSPSEPTLAARPHGMAIGR